MNRENFYIRTRSNNWRKMHHFPMRRATQMYKAKGKKRPKPIRKTHVVKCLKRNRINSVIELRDEVIRHGRT